MKITPTPVEPNEICVVCGEIGRIRIEPNDDMEKRGLESVQICFPCFKEVDATNFEDLWVNIKTTWIKGYWNKRDKIKSGDDTPPTELKEAGPDDFKFVLTILNDA